MKKFINSFLFNFIGVAIPIVILQLVVHPIAGEKLGADNFGLMLTLISLTNLISFPIGNVLNNIRLLHDQDYKDKGLVGDFNLILLIGTLLNTVVIGIMSFYYSKSVVDSVLLILMSNLILLRSYYSVGFLIELDYKKVLIDNIILSMGYALGFSLFYNGFKWQSIYIVANIASLIYIFFNTNLYHEGFNRTDQFAFIFKSTLILFASIFMKNAIDYADKILIFPLMDGASVSVYHSATISTKIFSLVFSAMGSVILSFVAKKDSLNKSELIKLQKSLLILSIIGYFLTYLLSIPVIKILYPNWAAESIQLVPITSATSIMISVISILNPFLMKFSGVKSQLSINTVTFIVYLFAIFVLQRSYGLIGVALAVLISNIIKVALHNVYIIKEYK